MQPSGILQPQVRQCLLEWNEDQTKAICVYLKVGYNMLQAYNEGELAYRITCKTCVVNDMFCKVMEGLARKV